MDKSGSFSLIRFRQGLFHGVDFHIAVATVPAGKIQDFFGKLETVPHRVVAPHAPVILEFDV